MSRTKHFESEKIAGASFDLLIIGRMVRHRAELTLADQRHESRLIAQRKLEILPELATSDTKPDEYQKAYDALKSEDKAKLSRLQWREEMISDEIYFAYLKTTLASFTLPGEEYAGITTTEELLESGPISFVDEVIAKVTLLWRLSSEETKNSLRPSTSGAPVDGPTNDMLVTDASADETTEPATAS